MASKSDDLVMAKWQLLRDKALSQEKFEKEIRKLAKRLKVSWSKVPQGLFSFLHTVFPAAGRNALP